ncbi:hypothetical protein FBU31_001471 [Coemansia sp. 'formosensis']|nr:hypothetical protein FBU31_001471 [Coemansia sp. 'formosensis']
MVGLVTHSRHTLPCDVVGLIVRAFYTQHVATPARSLSPDARFGRRLRRLTQLAAVDSQWRQAVMPHLYRTLVCEEEEERRADGNTTLWTTNVGLYGTSAKARAWARHLLVIPHAGLGSLADTLDQSGFFLTPWMGLRQATVVGNGCVNDDNDDSTLTFYRQLLPRIFIFPGDGRAVHLGDEFMHAFDLHPLSPENAPCVSMRLMNRSSFCPPQLALTDIAIRCAAPSALNLLSSFSDSLTAIRLCDIAPALAWDVMAVLGTLGAFAGLKSLALEFSDTSTSPSTAVAESGPITPPASLPLLQSLVIRHCPFDVRLCLAALVPTTHRLSCVEIHGSKSDVLMLPEMRGLLPKARCVVLACVGMARPPVDRAERFVSAALTGSSALTRAESLSLTAIAARPMGSIGNGAPIACVRLHTLELRVPLRLGAAESLLRQLPCLRRLCLPYVATESALLHASAGVVAATRGGGRVLSRSLQLLSMGFWDCRQDLRALSYAVLAFVADIPSLLTLVHDTHVAAAVRRLIDSNAADHLRNLVITDHTKLSF